MDLRLFEDGGERRSALGSDAAVRDAVSEGQDGNSERVGVSTGVDTKANTLWDGGAPERGHGTPLERLAQLGDAGVGASAVIIKATELVSVQPAKGRRGVSMGADTKANTLELVRVPSSLHQRLQRGVALESLDESGSSFGAESVALQTASRGVWLVVRSVNGR